MKRICFGLILVFVASSPCFGATLQDKARNGSTKNESRQERLAKKRAEKENQALE